MTGSETTILLGRLGADPVYRVTPVGNEVCEFSVARTVRKRENGPETTEWRRVVAWSKLARQCRDNLIKGSQVYIEGKIELKKWKDKKGETRASIVLEARVVTFLDGPRQSAVHGAVGS